MKFSTQQVLLGAIAPLASAFPAAMMERAMADPKMQARAAEIENMAKRQISASGASAVFEPIPNFDAKAQYIDITAGSGHEFVPPGDKDLRGPCPGLNAFANHNFLPHNGYATITQFVDVTSKVVGMGPVLAAFLAVLGATIDGDGVSWSIHGTPPPGVGGPLASQGHGISGSHNKYESDASPTRHDLYEDGENYRVNADLFQDLIDTTQGSGVVTLDDLTKFRSQRFDQQIANNPYFFNGPFTGVLVQPAAYTFIYRFMANHTAQEPLGTLSYETLQAWFSIEGESGSYTAKQGYERIPNNWYRRSLLYPYDTPYFLADAANAAAIYPKFLDIGGNVGGKTNNFAGVDVEDLTGGVIKSGQLAQGNNAACLAYQFAAQAKPDLALAVLNPLTKALGSLISSLGCPQLEKFDEALLEDFEGFKRSNVV